MRRPTPPCHCLKSLEEGNEAPPESLRAFPLSPLPPRGGGGGGGGGGDTPKPPPPPTPPPSPPPPSLRFLVGVRGRRERTPPGLRSPPPPSPLPGREAGGGR